MKDSDYLYIFVHVPKTAGSTFRYHAKKNLKEGECLLLTYDLVGLDSNDPKISDPAYKKALWKYLSGISKEKKRKIKLVYGHYVPYGVHKYFERPARYIAFFRDPIKRTASIYNYKTNMLAEEDSSGKKSPDYQKTFLVKGKSPSFEEWLTKKYNFRNNGLLTMTGFLKKYDFIKRSTLSKKNISDALEKFYFVGITKNYSEEVLFVYDQLGFNKYFFNQNVTKRKIDLKMVDGMKDLIIKKNKSDLKLYQLVLDINREFKEKNKDYRKKINYLKVKRWLLLPFTQTIYSPRNTLVRLGEELKKYLSN